MTETTISVTEAARNFADCLNRVHYQKVTFVLLKNGVPFARLVPDDGKVCTGGDLARIMTKVDLSPEEARAWRRDLRNGRKAIKSTRNRWR